jgi:hypothetical protein
LGASGGVGAVKNNFMKILQILIFLILKFGMQLSFAQGVNNLWLMGYENPYPPPYGGVKIDFGSGAPIISSDPRKINLLYQWLNFRSVG